MPDDLDAMFDRTRHESETQGFMGRENEPFPTSYDPCPTCGYKAKNPILESRVTELENRITAAKHELELALQWELEGSSTRGRIQKALEHLNST